jgi:hypothetical protein
MADKEHGWGHKMRCQAVIEEAQRIGHEVRVISNEHATTYHMTNLADKYVLYAALANYEPDWLVVDLPTIPRWIIDMTRVLRVSFATLNGVGHAMEALADVVWVQDTPERAILRQSIRDLHWLGGYKWYVWGGAADKLNLLNYFGKHMKHAPAWLVRTNLMTNFPKLDTWSPGQAEIVGTGNNALWYLARAGQVCSATGMSMWEAAFLNIPQYLVSLTDEHLHWAQNMADLGLAKVWRKIGLPEPDAFKTWLQEPFKLTGQRPDGLGAQRFIEELQR